MIRSDFSVLENPDIWEFQELFAAVFRNPPIVGHAPGNCDIFPPWCLMHNVSPTNHARWWATEDWLAVWLGTTLLAASLAAVALGTQSTEQIANPLSAALAKPQSWVSQRTGRTSGG